MPKQPQTKLNNWIFKSPFKFALISFGFSFLAVLIYNLFLSDTPASVLFTLILLGLIAATTIQIRSMPRITFDRQSFVATHMAQTITMVASFLLILFILPWFNIYGPALSVTGTLAYIVFALFALYTIGLLICNFYIKFRRIYDLKIPVLQTILTIPFGFSALWVAGFFMNEPKTKNASVITSQPYNKLIQKILSRPILLALAYTITTLLSGFIFGIRPVLLTFALALGFGIWSIGNKHTKSELPRRYTAYAIIVNICIWVAFFVFVFSANQITPDVQINISDTQTITEHPIQ